MVLILSLIFSPITQMSGGPLDKPLAKIAEKKRVAPVQILLAWVKAKDAISVTYASCHSWSRTQPLCSLNESSSSKKERLQLYLAAGDIGLVFPHNWILD